MNETQLTKIKDESDDIIWQDDDYILQLRNLDSILSREISRGWGNGYVGLPVGHKWYHFNYEDIPVTVHGGLTFAEELELDNRKYWVIGFDTAHCDDNLKNWSRQKVWEETVKLLNQCKAQDKLLKDTF